MIKRTNSAKQAIKRALKKLNASKSQLHLDLRNTLVKTEESYLTVLKEFESRADTRKSKEIEIANSDESRAKQVRAFIEICIKAIEDSDRKGEVGIKLTKNQLILAQNNLELIKRRAKVRKSLQDFSDKADNELWNWYDSFATFAVKSISDDSAALIALKMLQGGAIIAAGTGLLGAPAALAATGVGVIELIAKTVQKFNNVAEQDKTVARLERGLILLQTLNDLGFNWIKIMAEQKALR